MKIQQLARWFVYAKDEDTGETCELEIQSLPQSVERNLWTQVFGRKREQRWKKGWEIRSVDIEKSAEYQRLRAARALKDSRGAELAILNEESARAVSEAVGSPVKVGDFIKLDGHWTDKVKAAVLAEAPVDLLEFITEKATEMSSRRNEEEAEEGKD